jgi:outer membrane protein
VANAQEQNYHFTLEECINYALGNNFNRQRLKLSEEAAEVSYNQAKNERLPNLNGNLSESYSNSKNSSGMSGSAGLSSNVTIYNGGSINHSIEQSRLQKEQASYQTTQYENELIINILQSFLSVLGNEEMLKYQKSVLEASEEQVKQGRSLYNAGSMIESDYLLLEAQYASDLNNITNTEISRNNNLINLKNLLSMNPADNLEVIHPDTSVISNMSVLPSQQEVTERSLNYMPDMKISQYNVNIADMNVKLAQSNFLPSVNLGASIGTRHNDNDKSSFGTQLNDNLNEQIGITVNIPIFNRYNTKNNVTRNKIAMEQATLNYKQTELTIRQNIVQEYQNVVSAYNKYKVSDIMQNAYQKTFDAYRVRFNLGSITAVDLLQQQNNYISVLNDYIQSKYSFMLRRKILDVFMGEIITM